MEVLVKEKIDLSDLGRNLPPMIARDHVEELLGGVISSKTLANLDSLGAGPKRMRMGRKVVYLTEDLLEWLALRTTILN
jgi:predicted DNA-binding transcriptional regulator AlpA